MTKVFIVSVVLFDSYHPSKNTFSSESNSNKIEYIINGKLVDTWYDFEVASLTDLENIIKLHLRKWKSVYDNFQTFEV